MHNWKTLSAPEKIDVLIPLLRDGLTAAEIVRRFSNTTRNAVIGFVSRRQPYLRFSSGRTGGRYPSMQPRLKRTQAKAVARKRAIVPPRLRVVAGNIRAGKGETPFYPESSLSNSRMVNVVDLKPEQCRWPLYTDGARLFCGADAEKHKSYCEHHNKLAHLEIKSYCTYGEKQ